MQATALFSATLACATMVCCKKDNTQQPVARESKASIEAKAVPQLYEDKADLGRIRERGDLRVLVPQPGTSFLPRGESLQTHDENLLTEFGLRLGLRVDFIPVSRYASLEAMLLEGLGDIVAGQMTVTENRKKNMAFSAPLRVVEEVLVARKGAEDAPQKLEDLAGREVHVRSGTSYYETLVALQKNIDDLKIVQVEDGLDSENIAYEVSQGLRPLTMLDSHILAAVEQYNDRVEGLFSLGTGRQIAWAMRPENPDLLSAVNAFVMEKALSAHADERFVGDLQEIKRRGVLRVLTRNNPVTYYLHRGRQAGFDFALAEMIAKRLGVRLRMVVPPSRDLLIPWLLEGRGDMIAASLSITPERLDQVAFSLPYLFVQEMLVQATASAKPIESLEDLKGTTIHVRASSSYFQTLNSLQEKYGPFNIVSAAEDLETEQLVDQVADGAIALTVADSHLLDVELAYRDDVRAMALPLSLSKAAQPSAALLDNMKLSAAARKEAVDSVPIAFAVRPTNPELHRMLDEFVSATYRGMEYNMARRYYFGNRRRTEQAKSERIGKSGRLSPYDDIIKKYSQQYGLDWRLMAALAYQESRFEPTAKSWVGALGLFQVMPATGRELGFKNLFDPEESAHAGIKYVHQQIGRFDGRIDLKNRIRFALASYNAGRGHVLDAQRIARAKGWDDARWFGNVEQAMLLLQKPQYYRNARYGYCRGAEPVKYVSEIQNRYENYIKLTQ